MKGMVMKWATKDATVEQLHEELRATLVLSMTTGFPLHIAMRNSAPDFNKTFFNPAKFPAEALLLKKFEGPDDGESYFSSVVNTPEMHALLATDAEANELVQSHNTGRSKTMHPLLTTTFKLDDHAAFLGKMLPPLANFQVIHVTD
jgi:hypothetical protein